MVRALVTQNIHENSVSYSGQMAVGVVGRTRAVLSGAGGDWPRSAVVIYNMESFRTSVAVKNHTVTQL